MTQCLYLLTSRETLKYMLTVQVRFFFKKIGGDCADPVLYI